jgi:hypothetical protein
MSGLMGAIGQGLSAAGYAGGDLYAKQALAEQSSSLELDRQQRLAEFKAALEERTKNAPLNRIADKAKSLAQEDVPQEADPVSSLTGAGVTGFDGKAPDSSGFKGDPRELLAAIAKMPDGVDKQRAMAQLRSQYGADVESNKAAVAGKTRKRSADEALDAALEDAKLNDLPGYVAAKAIIPEKTITVADGAAVIDRHGKVIYQNSGKADRQLEVEDRKDARASEAEDRRDRRQLQQFAHMEAMQNARDGNGKAPAGWRWTDADHTKMEFIPGGPADPENKNKPLPGSTASGLLTNQDNLRRAQRAACAGQRRNSGRHQGRSERDWHEGLLPNQLLNRVDSGGVDTRAAIADLGSMVIHDRSGAAVSPQLNFRACSRSFRRRRTTPRRSRKSSACSSLTTRPSSPIR